MSDGAIDISIADSPCGPAALLERLLAIAGSPVDRTARSRLRDTYGVSAGPAGVPAISEGNVPDVAWCGSQISCGGASGSAFDTRSTTADRAWNSCPTMRRHTASHRATGSAVASRSWLRSLSVVRCDAAIRGGCMSRSVLIVLTSASGAYTPDRIPRPGAVDDDSDAAEVGDDCSTSEHAP